MLTLKQYLKREDQRISEALRREIARLDPVVQPLVQHIVEAGGKRVRPVLAILIGKALGGSSVPDDSTLYALASSVELIHSATLLHDDVMDDASLRRGRPAAHTVFGASQAILSGDVLLAAAMLIIIRLKNYEIMETCARAVELTASGQVEEGRNLRNPDLPLETYLRIISGKTAAIISCACEVGAIQAGASPEMIAEAAEFGRQIGIAFQLVDDALDIAPDNEIGKPTGGDLREGKFTMPLYYYLNSLEGPARSAFEARFRQGNFTDPEIAETVLAMRAAGCDERTREIAGRHLAEAEKILSKLPDSYERNLLRDLSKYIRTRKL